MNYLTKDSLLTSIGKEANLIGLELNDEASVIISEYGGRPLGLFPKANCYNLLWVNPDIKKAIRARSHVIGGDRYRVSPERDYFYKKPETWEDWESPSGLDPANYEILGSSNTSCTLSSQIFVINQRTKQESQGEITRHKFL